MTTEIVEKLLSQKIQEQGSQVSEIERKFEKHVFYVEAKMKEESEKLAEAVKKLDQQLETIRLQYLKTKRNESDLQNMHLSIHQSLTKHLPKEEVASPLSKKSSTALLERVLR